MDESQITIIFDGVVSILLIITIIYAIILNKKLKSVKGDRGELEALSNHFNASTKRAEKSIALLRKSSNDSANILDEQIQQANILRTELEELINQAHDAIDRVKKGLVNAPKPSSVPPAQKFDYADKLEDNLQINKNSSFNKVDEDELLLHDNEDNDDTSPERGFKGLQALLRKEERESKRTLSQKEPTSDAEEELLKALRSVK